MIYTVSTIKDTQDNIERFARRNLSAGADHLFLFLEGPEARLQAGRLDSEHVTAIPTGDAYWHGDAPASLNARQVVNANLANCLLSAFRWAKWLFHIDGDECLDIDKGYLGALSGDVRAVRLRPLEAVSRRRWPGEVTHFKRRLSQAELTALHRAGMIDTPSNRSYFRGHVIGKSGLRPSPYVTLRVHDVKTHDDAKLDHHRSHKLRMLHFESATGEEFIRKWTAHVSRGENRQAVRAERKAVLRAVHSILSSRLPEEDKARRLWTVYEQHGEEDLEALAVLGLLVTPDKDCHSYTPAAHTARQAALLRDLLPHLLRADKRFFRPKCREKHPLDLLRPLAARLQSERPELADRVASAIRR